MIKSKSDYEYYLERDRIALGMNTTSIKSSIRQIIAPNYSWKLQKKLRKLEYYKNTKHSFLGRTIYLYLKFSYRLYCFKCGVEIPENVFGSGLAIVHFGGTVINSNTIVGKNCRIQAGVNIGASGGNPEAPSIGDNVYIGPGVKIYGNISIPNNSVIAANAAVGKSFLKEGTMIGGIPAEVIKTINIKKIIICAD
jgi:serine O-acetyltransferase